MASAVLHIKDSYYFEVPKFLWSVNHQDKADYPDVWVRLDPDFQKWEAARFYPEYARLRGAEAKPFAELSTAYETWKHDHAHAGKSFATFLEESADSEWYAQNATQTAFAADWASAERVAGDLAAYRADRTITWQPEKIAGYNQALSGKILIPQPFGTLRNLYEADSGLCISKFMVVEVAVACILFVLFTWLAKRVSTAERPKGRLWNLLEAFVCFIRDQVARPAIGDHDADQFVPLLLTSFFFVLGCNLAGMLPWVGAPTGSWGVTLALAAVTFATVIVFGMLKFGPIGFFLNQIPSMDLPIWIAVVIKPVLLAIELLGLCIKHAVLSIRLLANIVAGHLVLLAIMLMAFSLEGALSPAWPITAVIAVLGSTAFSCLELFVAVLQAYIFTFLSALFIGAAIHHH